MTARLATVLIFLFCGTMTVLLIRSVLYPEESRLAEVAAQVPFDLFAARTEGSHLDIWEGNLITGKCEIVPHSGDSGPLARHESIEVRLEIVLQLRQTFMGSDLIDVSGPAVVHIDGKLSDYDLDISLLNSIPLIKLSITQPADQKWPALKLTRGNAVLFESSAGKLLEGNGGIAGGMLLALGIPPDALSGKQMENKATSSVRAGHIEAGDQTFDGYLFTSGENEETKFRLYLSNTGEILRIKTPLGLEMLAESLRPAGVEVPSLQRFGRAIPKP